MRIRSLALGLAVSACTATPSPPQLDPDAGVGAPDAGAPDAGPSGPSYHGEVQAILQNRCEVCHHEGGPAPLDFVGYENARPWASRMGTMVAERKMPPWGAATTAECAPPLPYLGDPTLPDDERRTLLEWAAHGAPEGDPARTLPPKVHAPLALAPVDRELAVRSAYTVAPGFRDEFRCFVLDFETDRRVWVSGMDVLAGDKRVVHHAIVFTDPNGEAAAKAGADGSYACFGGPGVSGTSVLHAWAPGATPLDLDPRLGIPLEAGTKLVLQIHYHPTIEPVADRTTIQMRLAPRKPLYEVAVTLIGNFADLQASGDGLQPGPNDRAGPEFRIPAGARGHVETLRFTMPERIGPVPLPDLKVAFVGTHMHYVGTGMRIEVERDGQSDVCLLETPAWDFRWQRGYAYDADLDALPIVKAKDRLKMTCTYDNSMNNPFVAEALAALGRAEPSDVWLGEETLDEMCLGVFGFAYPARP